MVTGNYSGDSDKNPVIVKNTVVVGTGAAGFNAADRLYQYGQTDLAIITEGTKIGTSRNTGSDKQTYYKLTLAGKEPDSVRSMAQTLFDGQCVDGDLALCEAALSAQCFFRLTELGVPFPRNRYGEYIGYKTDHDSHHRATSIGPYTSKIMTECLEKSVRAKDIPIYDGLQVIRILSDGRKVYGLLCLNCQHLDRPGQRFLVFRCKNIVWATGGPAGMYSDSVYPFGHYGATGTAFAAGAMGKNLTEWQYGLASIKPRWNVSGTYMQVLPRFISTNQDGGEEREFLYDFFQKEGQLLTNVFLKGYQWPFDVRKIANGSSIIDILVYMEKKKGRRVFLDFRTNPGNKPVNFSLLSSEALEYLQKADACFGTPLERLMRMNAPAADFYLEKGVDLSKRPLEIALCAQHNNGGLAVDCWWQTNVDGLFCAGEAAASHGVYRPGGSALNAGQVGSTRAAQFIAAKCGGIPADDGEFERLASEAKNEADSLCRAVISQNENNVGNLWKKAADCMSLYGGAMRSESGLLKALDTVRKIRMNFSALVRISQEKQLSSVFRLQDTLLCQEIYLDAMLNYLHESGISRGSSFYTDQSGSKPYNQLPPEFAFRAGPDPKSNQVQEVLWKDKECLFSWRKVRPIPEEDDFFENVWHSYRKSQNIF